MMTSEDTISSLNGLIETSRNGELGYAEAAKLVKDTRLQTILEGYSKEARRVREGAASGG